MQDRYPTTPLPDDPDAEATEWVDAPAESHVKAFRYVDRSQSRLGGPSEVWVTFKAKDTKTKHYPEVTYKYEWYDHSAGLEAWGAISEAGSPGQVIDGWKKSHVPYHGPM